MKKIVSLKLLNLNEKVAKKIRYIFEKSTDYKKLRNFLWKKFQVEAKQKKQN